MLDAVQRARDHAPMSKWKTHIVLDVESDGPCPGLYNLISFGLVSLGDPAQSFLGEVAPSKSAAKPSTRTTPSMMPVATPMCTCAAA